MQTTDPTARLDRFLANPRRGMWGMALPMMAGMSLHTIYMIADLIFVGMLGARELEAVAFDMPLVFLGLGVTFGLGSGVTAVVARYVGARDAAGADRAAQNGLLMGLVLTAIFTVVGGLFGHELLASMGVPADLLPIAWEFFGPIVYGYLFLVLSVFFRSILAGEGDMRTPMMIQGASTLLNIALDPLFMFTFGLGVRGAAYATVLSQAAAALTFVWMLYRRGRSYVRFDPRDFRPSARLLADIARIGAPASFSFLIIAVSSGFFNRLLIEYSPQVVAAYQVGGRLDHVVMLPMISISTALVAMVAMFRGAERMDLVRDLVNYSMRWAIGIGAVMALFFYLLAPYMMRGFSDESAIVVAGIGYLHYIVWSYPFVAISMLASRILQGLGIGSPSLILTVMRVILVAAPLAWVLVYLFHTSVAGVWLAMLIGVVVTAVVSMIWLRVGLSRAERGALGLAGGARASVETVPVA
ncbi:MAG TPA: MATE family efflux transporter [Thermoanaerobaculia bacterium]|nr:MATE family efflux transporter [Thermoanaerobaculia bacterium]